MKKFIVIAGNSIVLDGPRDTVLQQLQKMNSNSKAAEPQPQAAEGAPA